MLLAFVIYIPVAGPALASTLLAGPIYAAAEATPPAETPQPERLTISPEEVMEPWTGDLDGMITRRVIRVLTVYSKTFYFVNKGIQRGTTYDIFHLFETDLNKKLAKSKQLKNRHVKVRVVFIPVHRGDLLQALVAGKGDIAWAIRKGSPQLKAALDDFTTRYGAGTTEGNRILTRYLKRARYVKNAAAESERKKFLALVQNFQKYGDKYHVDWLLMAAQGYQESQLNQAARSPAGAIGVMQVMPATGEDLRVGDITQTEPNIHAGVKYMRWMIDKYYGEEPMTQLDKALFAFASYNAGPGRISQLHKVAAKRGLDPNVWFDNVEYIAAEKIGAETVTYVSNIYKYYIAYRLIMEAREDREQAIEEMKGQSKGAP
jgi:membrane-bound lytic murein transglycosylase MltF